ncbi:type I restriction endonuclease subunit R [Azospirillum sp. B506]|uniref:type I restriction endonuclease subunit R n=1 Tax=Azospirillum sp. B506 TaxID=137721 RepID=UPI000349F6F3|nr:type I restriction endonuclease subunit R [Azospirillum sp. B506]
MSTLSESHVEQAALAWLAELGYTITSGPAIAPDGAAAERASYQDVVLARRLVQAVARLNPAIPEEARAEALRVLRRVEYPGLIEENRRLHRMLVEGVPVEFYGDDGVLKGDHVRLIDFDDPQANDWLAVNQFTIVEQKANRRPDVVLFVNGLPVVVVELKNAGDENATLDGAFNQLQTYKAQIPSLFRSNTALVISDGLGARIGSLTAGRERFMPWRTIEGDGLTKGMAELEILLKGAFEPRRFLALLKDFTVFGETGGGLAKILAGYHQFHAVRHAVEQTVAATGPQGDRRIGVVWHTQGSGKSLLMAFYAGQVILHPAMGNPTLVVLTDRNDLDQQLFATFGMCKDLLRQTPQRAESREELRSLLTRPSGGVIFTTIQKFQPVDGEKDHPLLTDRRNVVVMADEAHRSQYGFKMKVDAKDGETSYGFAKYLRDALPRASFIGFTGTPIESSDVNTPAIFGDYIDIYDISRAVTDEATVPIYYESRLARIELPEEEKPRIDAEIAQLTEDLLEGEEERLGRKYGSVEAVVGADRRLAMVAADLIAHAESRFAALDGKAMVVCMSRRICVELYKHIVALRPTWHSDDDEQGAVKVVMTGVPSNPPDWQPHIGKRPKARRELLAKRAKDPDDPLRLVIVRDMWLTGFDAPSMHTMYIDKPMKGHGLMQAIARVNRVFRDKPAGLVVDYIGIAQNLKAALGQYSGADGEQTGIDEEEAIAAMVERYEVVRDMFRPGMADGFDYRPALAETATPQLRLTIMAGAMDWVLAMQQALAADKKTEEEKKRAHRHYADAVLILSKLHAMAAASEEARDIRDEVGFFQAVRAALIKTGAGGGRSGADRELAIQQLVSRAVVSTEIVDIMAAIGLNRPDISILSDEFLAEMRDLEKKNLAVEALRKLLNGQVHSMGKRNVVQARAFSERLEAAITRYHNNAVTTVEVLEELIAMAREIEASRRQGEESGLGEDEIAFYTALADNKSARDMMGEPALRVIAHELVQDIRKNLTVDWAHRESARADIRRRVKRILRKYGYPPDLQDMAVQNVLQQAEALSAELV